MTESEFLQAMYRHLCSLSRVDEYDETTADGFITHLPYTFELFVTSPMAHAAVAAWKDVWR